MSTVYRRHKLWWFKTRVPGLPKPLYVPLKIADKAMAKHRQFQLDKVLLELRLPEATWTFTDDLRRDPQLLVLVISVCRQLGITLTLRMNVPIAEALEGYKAYSAVKKTARSHNTDMARITEFLKHAGCKNLDELRALHVQNFLLHRIEHKHIEKSTANHTLTAIKAFLNWCVKHDLMRENPANKIERFKVPHVPQHYLKDPADIVRLLQTAQAQDPAMYPMVVAAVFTGCRLGELMGLEWRDIDFTGRRVIVRDKPELGLRTKSGRVRVIPLHPDLAELLLRYRKKYGFVFFPERKERKYTSPLYRRWQDIRKAAKMPETTWYSLRRTFCSHLAMSGVSLLRGLSP